MPISLPDLNEAFDDFVFLLFGVNLFVALFGVAAGLVRAFRPAISTWLRRLSITALLYEGVISCITAAQLAGFPHKQHLDTALLLLTFVPIGLAILSWGYVATATPRQDRLPSMSGERTSGL